MDRNNDKITSSQLFSIMVTLIIGIGILSLPAFLADKAGPDSLIMMLLGSILFFLVAMAILQLLTKFPQCSIVEIGNSLIGRPFGKILGFGYFMYTLILIALQVRAFGEISKSFLLISTPIEIIIISFLVSSIYTVRSGIETIARLSVIIMPLSIIPSLITMGIVLPEIDITNFMPVLKTPIKNLISVLPGIVFSFLGFEYILFLNYFVGDSKKIKKTGKAAVLIVAFVYLFTVFITIGRFGVEGTKNLIWPIVTLFKTIKIPGTLLENVEVVILSTWLLSIFMTMSITYFASVILLNRVIESKEHNYLVIPLGPIIYFLAIIPENVVEIYDYLGMYAETVGMIFGIVIPILLFSISFFRKKPTKGMKRNV